MVETKSYGQLLGEYFTIASTIGELESRHDPAELDDHERYQRLIQERQALQRQLDEVSQSRSNSEIKDVLDEAFSSR